MWIIKICTPHFASHRRTLVLIICAICQNGRNEESFPISINTNFLWQFNFFFFPSLDFSKHNFINCVFSKPKLQLSVTMASTSKSKNSLLFGSKIKVPIVDGNQVYVPEPPLKAERLKELYPSYHGTKLIICIKQPIDLNYMNAIFRVFRSAPSTQNKEDYIARLDKVESKKAKI